MYFFRYFFLIMRTWSAIGPFFRNTRIQKKILNTMISNFACIRSLYFFLDSCIFESWITTNKQTSIGYCCYCTCYLCPYHKYGHTFSRYFIISIKLIIIPSFSFIEADLAKRCLLIGVLDGTLKAGCSNVI